MESVNENRNKNCSLSNHHRSSSKHLLLKQCIHTYIYNELKYMNEPLSRDFEFVRPLRELVRPSDEISEQDEFLPSYNTMDESK